MKLVQVAEQNKKYYTKEFIHGFNTGAKTQLEADKRDAERRGRWEMKEDPYGFFDTIPVCSACGCTTKYRVTSTYCPNCGARMEETP